MDMTDYLRFALALVFVLGLIGVLASLARKAGLGFPAKALSPSGKRRLSVVEVTPLDARRKLALIRRDDVEHLILLTPNSELVVEAGIKPGGSFSTALETAYAGGLDPTRVPMDKSEDGA